MLSVYPPIVRATIHLNGVVQGHGVRPQIFHLANEFGVTGHVQNVGTGVMILAYASERKLDQFIRALQTKLPRVECSITTTAVSDKNALPQSFSILKSKTTEIDTEVAPDIGVCDTCLRESRQTDNRRSAYAFNHCIRCGPRYSVMKTLPYDRVNTSYAAFEMCETCQSEFHDVSHDRFHAQLNTCERCGPKMWLVDSVGGIVSDESHAVATQTVEFLRQGKILAIKGMSGFHLVCDAKNEDAVQTLRDRKKRPQKPFSLMMSESMIARYCHASADELEHLKHSSRPIVLLKKRTELAGIAPGLSTFGVQLPNTVFYDELVGRFENPLVATSGNVSGNALCHTNKQATSQLLTIADVAVLHNRDIVRPLDDSILRIDKSSRRMLRRARGFVPASIELPPGFENANQIFAAGGDLKNTFCFIRKGRACLSGHIGDLRQGDTFNHYRSTQQSFKDLFDFTPATVVADRHPDYHSTRFAMEYAERFNVPMATVQHHHAHIAACLAENGWPLSGKKVLGIVLDGFGLGEGGQAWGGEFLLADYREMKRVGCCKPVPLSGGDAAAREPWRMLLSHLYAAGCLDAGQHMVKDKKADVLLRALAGTHHTLTSSAGRLFDAVAAALEICAERVSYEGEAAMKLEALALEHECDEHYPFSVECMSGFFELNPAPMWWRLIDDIENKVAREVMSCRFHEGFARGILQTVHAIHAYYPVFDTVALSGGVFQNRMLSDRLHGLLKDAGLRVLSHTQVPCNDGGLALGQGVIGAARFL